VCQQPQLLLQQLILYQQHETGVACDQQRILSNAVTNSFVSTAAVALVGTLPVLLAAKHCSPNKRSSWMLSL
jgi:hypothetical protein